MNRRVISILLVLGATANSGFEIEPNPMNWYPGKPADSSILFCLKPSHLLGWSCSETFYHDGSAELRVVPSTYDWPEEGLPRTGIITVAHGDITRESLYIMERRHDDEGNPFMYASFPVGTFNRYDNMKLEMFVYAADGTLVSKYWHSWGDVPDRE